MKCSELIRQLQDYMREAGDLPVRFTDDIDDNPGDEVDCVDKYTPLQLVEDHWYDPGVAEEEAKYIYIGP